ncbi:Ubiquitin carboxyl-terminal hydrolase 37 [Haplosporangium sp. Z 11]|nr:Ubiquitin carboxyl-terminal hydrolase 37 [Haplosporangium sp. Z 11]
MGAMLRQKAPDVENQAVLNVSLVDALSLHSKDASQILEEELISNYIVKSPNGSLGDEEDDAHGFLNDCLNQVRREFQERSVDADYPLSRLFECDIDHVLICQNCAHESIQTEHQQIFRLELPVANTNRSIQQTTSIGSLFPQFFESQHIAFECDMCQSESAMVHRSISKLPKVLVISLKRFTRRPSHGYSMNRSRVNIDETLDFGYDNINVHGSLAHSSVADPIELLSDDENIYDLSLSQTHSFYEAPSEDEQYRWAIEESLRTSQSNSQESNLDKDECPSQVFGVDNPLNSHLLDMEGGKNDKDIDDDVKGNVDPLRYDNDIKSISNLDNVESKDKDENKGNIEKGIVVISDDEDEEVKAAIEASLLPVDILSSTDDELREKENREMEEAIRRSLIDQEDNKENISPEKNVDKKEKRDKSVSVKTQQREIPTPARLQRANTIDGDGSLTASSDVSEWLQSCSQPLPQRRQQQHHARFLSGASTSTADSNYGQQFYSRSTATTDKSDSIQPTRPTKESEGTGKENGYEMGKGKGKERAPEKTRMKCEVSDQGLFRLQAAISHTGLTSTTSEGYYICDRRGADGIWRCHEGHKRTKIGPISDLSRHRGRSGYLFFYVSCRPE